MDLFILFKSEPFNQVKPFHLEKLDDYENRRPPHPSWKKIGIFLSVAQAMSAMRNDLKANTKNLKAYRKMWGC